MKMIPSAVLYMILGVALGNSGLGSMIPIVDWLSMSGILGLMKFLGLIGLIVFVYEIGAHLDLHQVRTDIQCKKFCTIVAGGLIIPAVAGFAFGMAIYPLLKLDSSVLSITTFALVNAIIFPTAAVPVLGKILEDLKIEDSYRLVIIAAVIGDIILWPAVGFVKTGSAHTALVAAFGLLILALASLTVREQLIEVARSIKNAPYSSATKSAMLVGVCGAFAFLSACATELLGIHWVPGAFLAGVMTPSEVYEPVKTWFKKTGNVLIIPFFLGPGLVLSVNLGSTIVVALSLAYIVFAGGSKLISVYGFTRYTGHSHKRSLKFAWLLNTRGTVEMVVATTFASLGFLPGEVYAAVIVMTIVCTAITVPAIHFIWQRHPQQTHEYARFVEVKDLRV